MRRLHDGPRAPSAPNTCTWCSAAPPRLRRAAAPRPVMDANSEETTSIFAALMPRARAGLRCVCRGAGVQATTNEAERAATHGSGAAAAQQPRARKRRTPKGEPDLGEGGQL